MSSDTIRVGIIGCGMITQRSHAPGFAKVGGVTITALCDPVAENAVKVQKEHAPDARLFSDWRELLKSGLVDAVSVATPVYLHAPMSVAALEAGCHVLCEKPMAMSSAEATGRARRHPRVGPEWRPAGRHRRGVIHNLPVRTPLGTRRWGLREDRCVRGS